MDKIVTKRMQTQLSDYFLSGTEMTRPELRCLKDMVIGVLKSRSVFVNQMAASLREPLKLKDVCKRLSSQYLKEDYAQKVTDGHLNNVSPGISNDGFILMDGTDISKKHAKYMEGLEFVKNGDTGKIGLGYNVPNINAIGTDRTMVPLFSRAYSYEMGALSSNNEIKKAVREVKNHIDDKGCWVFDRGADNTILRDFFIEECPRAIIRLKKNTKLWYKLEEHQVNKLAAKIDLSIERTVIKIKKDRPVPEHYRIGAIPINYTIKGKTYALWLVVSKNKRHGGLCYLLVKSKLSTAMEVAQWAFKGYGRGTTPLRVRRRWTRPCSPTGGGRPREGERQQEARSGGHKEKGEGREPALRKGVIPHADAACLGGFMKYHIDPKANVTTDQWTGYGPLAKDFVNLKRIPYGKKGSNFPELHRAIMNLKGWLRGMHHHVEDLQDYLDEYCYRFNRSFMKEGIFDNLILRMVKAPPCPVKNISG